MHSLLNIKLEIDSLAQLVEHNTFNVGVMGSSPMRVTDLQEKGFPLRKAFFLLYPITGYCRNSFLKHFSLSLYPLLNIIRKLREEIIAGDTLHFIY